MSDFLSQFEGRNYKKEPKESKPKAENKKVTLEEYMPIKEESEGISSVVHDTQIDTKYHKRKIIRYVVIASTIILVSIIIFFTFFFINRITVRNFVGMNVSEVKTWGLKNNIEIDIETVYSIEQDENFVISQSKPQDSKMQKGSILYLTVSKGADPEETIAFPDFTNMTLSQIKDWISQIKANNMNVIQEYHEEIPKNGFIRIEFKEAEVNEGNYRRKDSAVVYVSRGSQKDEKNVTVPDFKGKTKSEIEGWSKTNQVKIAFTESGSDEIDQGMAISQDIKPESKIARTDVITVAISLGKGATVPNFANYTKEEAGAASLELAITVKTKYSTEVAYGKLISQSVRSGNRLYGENKKVEVVYSEGSPYIDNLVGTKEKDLVAYFYNFQAKGAKITYNVDYVDAAEEKGTVTWASIYNEFVGLDAHVTIHVSNGSITPSSNSNTNTGNVI